MGRYNRYRWNCSCDTNIYTYDSQTLFFRPVLRIEFDPEKESNTFAPAHNDTKYLKIRIRNSGKSTAQNCNAKVRIIPTETHHFMDVPSIDKYFTLVWGSEPDLTDLKDTVNIQRDNWDILHVVFAYRYFSQIPTGENTPTRYASFSLKQRLPNNELSIEDSFTIGDYLIEIIINSEETNTKARFKVHVDANYMNLSTNMLPQLTRIEKIKYKFLHIFK
jgi:hypothetical protein